MSQYKAGTVTVTNGDATVAGVGTTWLTGAPITAGDMFSKSASGVPYFVGSITSDTALELSANYAGATLSGQAYFISRDFTAVHDFPLMTAGDIDTPTIYNRLVAMLETKFGTAAYTAGRVTFADASGNLTTDAGLAYNSATDLLTVGALTVSTGALTAVTGVFSGLITATGVAAVADSEVRSDAGVGKYAQHTFYENGALKWNIYNDFVTDALNFGTGAGSKADLTTTGGLTLAGTLTVGATIKPGGYTVATLPAGTIGMKAYVTDAVAPAFLALLVGGGAAYSGAQYSGANWVGD